MSKTFEVRMRHDIMKGTTMYQCRVQKHDWQMMSKYNNQLVYNTNCVSLDLHMFVFRSEGTVLARNHPA